MNASYSIEGMSCGGCVSSVQKALLAALPNNTVEVVLEGGLVHVSGEHDLAELRNAVEDAGFDFVGPAGA
ncbi:MAG: copper chaperone [Bradymonadia bacterium]|jgi:copper chaperone